MALFYVGKFERNAIEENAAYWRGLSASRERQAGSHDPTLPRESRVNMLPFL